LIISEIVESEGKHKKTCIIYNYLFNLQIKYIYSNTFYTNLSFAPQLDCIYIIKFEIMIKSMWLLKSTHVNNQIDHESKFNAEILELVQQIDKIRYVLVKYSRKYIYSNITCFKY